MLDALNIVKPTPSVEPMRPGICGCQWHSFRSCCPMCKNRSCAGSSSGAIALPSGARDASSSGSRSSARSHTASWLSAAELASMDPSYGHHSMPVTWLRWNPKLLTWPSCVKLRKSQIRTEPSSAPLASIYVTSPFQLMTFTSESCALTLIMGLLRSRVSQMRMVWSTLALANTVSSVGLHCTSSTLDSWPAYAPLTCHRPPSWGSQTWMFLRQSPVARRPALSLDQSMAYPSIACPCCARGRKSILFRDLGAGSDSAAISCSSRVPSIMSTLALSPHTATMPGCCGQLRTRLTPPWWFTILTCMRGGPCSSHSSSSSLSPLLSDMLSSSLSSSSSFLAFFPCLPCPRLASLRKAT
mmetsp:Transcript_1980/g.5032  ORF Transcript_1980/g.5032 Transcript_1980/m.5032 type:complete len:356 (+) Transcript_1980:499-1566(+)